MSEDLFRPEALEYQATSNSRFGKPTGVLPPSWSRITLLIALFMAVLFVFLLNVDFARKETVRGKLRVDGAEAKIYALEQGVIIKVFVEDGQLIQIGQPIAEISSERFLSDGTELSAETLASLQAENASLQQRRSSVIKAARLSSEAATQRSTNAKRREEEAGKELVAAESLLVIAQQRAKDALGLLDKGLLAEPVYNERREVVAGLQQSILQLQARVAGEKAAQEQFVLEYRQVGANRSRDLAEIDQRLSQMDGQMRKTARETSHVVRSPIAGRLTALQARVGENATPDVPLSVILPEGAALIAEVFVPSRAIGFVETGQEVKLQYDAFPYQKFGVGYGSVTRVSSTAQRPQEVGVISETGEPLYRVEITLRNQSVEASSRTFPLHVGMELTADIVLENRRLFEWVMDPLRS